MFISFAYVIVLIFTRFAVYYPILFNDFLNYWDDQIIVMNRFTEGGINFNNLWAILTQFHAGQYAPVNESLYLLLYTIFGYNAAVFHLTSLLLHTGCVCLTYIIILRIFSFAASTSNHLPVQNVSAIAFCTALLFAVHPMNVEAVAWMSASKVLIYTLFYLLATHTYIIYLDRKKIRYFILTIGLFVLSFGSKEQAVSFPVWLLMLNWLFGRPFRDRKLWIEIAPFFVLSLAFGIVTIYSHVPSGGGLFSLQESYPLWQRFILGSYAFIEYIVKFVVPINLLYLYPFPMLIGEALPTWMLLYPAIIFIICVTLWDHIKKMPLAGGLAFFLAHILVALHIIPISRFVVVADRYIYIAGLGLAFVIVWYFVYFLSSRKTYVRKLAIVCFSCITLSFCVYANIRCRDWKDTNSIKKEIRELLQRRDDYIPPPEVEKLMEESNINKKISTMLCQLIIY